MKFTIHDINREAVVFVQGGGGTAFKDWRHWWVSVAKDMLERGSMDGVIIEHFNAILSQEPEQIAEDIERMTRAGKDGKIVILKAFPGFLWINKEDMEMPLEEKLRLARQRITFPLAAFLIAAQEHSYFNYNWGIVCTGYYGIEIL